MADFRDAVLDRIHEISSRLMKTTSKDNPTRAPSTVKVVVAELEPLVCELELLCALVKRVCPNRP